MTFDDDDDDKDNDGEDGDDGDDNDDVDDVYDVVDDDDDQEGRNKGLNDKKRKKIGKMKDGKIEELKFDVKNKWWKNIRIDDW